MLEADIIKYLYSNNYILMRAGLMNTCTVIQIFRPVGQAGFEPATDGL